MTPLPANLGVVRVPFSSAARVFAYGTSSTSHPLYRQQAVCSECVIVAQRLYRTLALFMHTDRATWAYLVQ